MPLEVRIAIAALADVEEAVSWMQQRSPAAAARWYDALMATIATLESHPQRCPLAPESEDAGVEVRELLFGKRRGVYRNL
jgi:plasmid stabilization system protein ParE